MINVDADFAIASFIVRRRNLGSGPVARSADARNPAHSRRQAETSAPAPKASDGKPDLSGLWRWESKSASARTSRAICPRVISSPGWLLSLAGVSEDIRER